MKRSIFAVLFLFISLSGGFTIAAPSGGALEGLGNKILKENKKLAGEWKERQTWNSWLCDGFYQYKTNVGAVLTKVDFQLTDKDYMIATANLEKLFANAEGAYRSKATLCLPLAGRLLVGLDWAELKTEVHFGESADFKDVRLKILSTTLGRIHLGHYVPMWFEDFFTGVVNRALSVVWNSRLGSWLSDKITDVARKKIPERNR